MVSNKTHTQPANKTENLYNSTKSQQSYTPTYHQARIGSINVRTAKDEMRLAQHMIQIKNLKQDITCMQEARIINQGEIIFDDPILDGWKLVHNGMKTAVAGVAIVLAPHVQLIDIIHILDGRISCVRVKVRGTKLAVFSCYAPTEQHAPSTKESFHNCLSKAIITMKKEHSSYKLVICGDFNATIGNDCDPDSWNSIGKFNDDAPTSFNGTKLIETAHSHNLYLLNTMYATKTDKHRWSFQSNLGYERRLDYIMVEWYIKRFARNCRCYPQASLPFDSDHRILVLDLQLPSKKTVKKIFKGKSTQEKTANYDVRPLRDSELVRLGYTQLIDRLLDTPPTSTQIDELEKIIVDALTEASKKVLLKLEREKDVKPWMDVKFLQMVEERHREKDDKNNKALGKRIKNLRISLKNKYFKQKANAINEASEMRDTEEEFRLAKGYTSLSRSARPMIQPNVLEKHFISHFSNRETIIQPEISHPQEFPHILPPKDLQGVDETCPTEAEVKQTLSGFNNGKCQGTDNLKAEQLKYSESKNLLKYLVFFLHIIWTNMVIPSAWLLSSITCLHKKGLKSLASNYRGISIISTLSKLVSKLIVERIRSNYERLLLPTQFGFRQNRSTCDAIFICRHIIMKTKTPLFISFIDLKAAYDWIPRSMLFEVLKIRLQSPKLVEILQLLYTGTKACIKGSRTYFDTLVGCRQGALESPPIFNIYMDFVVRCAREEVKQKYPAAGALVEYVIPNECSSRDLRSRAGTCGETKLTEVLYADDEAIFANSIAELTDILRIYDRTFTRFGLQMAYSKTETMTFNTPENITHAESLVTINNVKLKNVRQFKYLGHMLTNDNSKPSTFLHTRIASAFGKWNEMKHVLADSDICLATRMRFLTACVRSRLLYSCQSWELNSEEIRKVEVVWNGFLRKMVRGGYSRKNAPPRSKRKKNTDPNMQVEGELDWSYKISNKKLCELTRSSSIAEFCHVQHFKYIAHVCRMENNALQKMLLFDKRSGNTSWNKAEKLLDIDKRQILRTMMIRKDFMELLDGRFPTTSRQFRPKSSNSMSGKN